MYGNSTSSVSSTACVGESAANGTGPMNARARFFNPYPIQRHALG